MRSLSNCLGDPSLHLLTVAMIIIYLTFGRGFQTEELSAESPLAECKACRIHFLPGTACDCPPLGPFAQALP